MQLCFICRLSLSAVWKDAVIETMQDRCDFGTLYSYLALDVLQHFFLFIY